MKTQSHFQPTIARWQNRIAGLMLAFAFGFTATANSAPDPVDEPLPMVGTDAHGHAYPGAAVPFGMVQLSPDTPLRGWDWCSGYHYSDSVIVGFSHTHLSGTGCGCLGDVMLMPTVGKVFLDAGSPGQGYSSHFAHAREHATPGSYSVFLEDPKVEVELTATARCGFHKYVFPKSDAAHVILDLDHNIGNGTVEASLKVEDNQTISGYRISDGWGGRRDIYFVMQFSKPFDSFEVVQDGQQLGAGAQEGKGKIVKASFNYKTDDDEAVLVKVGISGTGVEGARKNLAAEIPGWDFAAVRAAAVQQWRQVFNTVQIQTPDPHLRTTFYANLYLSSLAPTLFNDVDGTYRGYDHQNHTSTNFQNYTTFSIWDIYRAEWPLMTLLHPERVNDMVQSLLAGYRELGQHTTPIWPVWGGETWCMIGYHSVDMIATAYLNGFRGFDPEEAYQAMRDTAMQDRNGLRSYKRLGYVASRPGDQATSKTLEYTYDDWCIARMAEALGHDSDAALFYQRSSNYRNLFDSRTQFFRGRKGNGQWRTPFIDIALVGDEYTEADAWQYAFDVQQNVPDLISLYGGDLGFIQKMDTMFTTNSTIITDIPDISGRIGQYSQGDEQSHHVAYLYDYAGAPYKTQRWVRQTMATMYGDTPAGQCGNVDCGQMAAWYIFSALGFYPVNPASGVYVIGSPVVSKAVIHLDGDQYHGTTFTVIAKNNNAQNIYIESAELNGKPYSKPWLTAAQITAGGTLRLVMGPNPNPDWGRAQKDRPPTTMPADFHYQDLPAPASDELVQLPLPIRVVCGADEAVGGFVPDPNSVAVGMNHAEVSVNTDVPNAAPAEVYQNEGYGSDFTYTYPVHPGLHYVVRLHFAEIFDNGSGSRIENIAINGQQVLTNLDIFAAAGGMNRALVKEFRDVVPDDHGNISIHITAAPGSPDQNAKISALEILKQDSSDSAGASVPLIFTTADGKTTITIDTSVAPDLTDWVKNKLAPVLVEWYPKIVGLLPSDGYTAPTHFKITVKEMDGVAYTSGTDVSVSEQWIHQQMNGEAVGSLVHECVHVVQQYNWGDAPGWLVEGMADYVRWFKYEPQSHGADIVWMRHIRHFSPHYDESYRVSANFLNWVTDKYDANLVPEVNAALRTGKYTDDFWKQHTGKTVQDLGGEWRKEIETELPAPVTADK